MSALVLWQCNQWELQTTASIYPVVLRDWREGRWEGLPTALSSAVCSVTVRLRESWPDKMPTPTRASPEDASTVYSVLSNPITTPDTKRNDG